LAREPLDGRRRSLRDIAAALAPRHANLKPSAHTAVARMIDRANGKRRRAA
jgi:hypothetical protein